MTLDEAKASAKQGLVSQINDYINETMPASTIVHALVWRVNAIADGAQPTQQTEALIQSILNFVVRLQAAAQPFFARIDAATTVAAVWTAQAGFSPHVVPRPVGGGVAFYAALLQRTPGDPT